MKPSPVILNPGDWLYDTSYWCKCRTCGERYFGPKRSPNCWEHTDESMKEAWVASHQESLNPPLVGTSSGQ